PGTAGFEVAPFASALRRESPFGKLARLVEVGGHDDLSTRIGEARLAAAIGETNERGGRRGRRRRRCLRGGGARSNGGVADRQTNREGQTPPSRHPDPLRQITLAFSAACWTRSRRSASRASRLCALSVDVPLARRRLGLRPGGVGPAQVH